jgi:hypothetical protein
MVALQVVGFAIHVGRVWRRSLPNLAKTHLCSPAVSSDTSVTRMPVRLEIPLVYREFIRGVCVFIFCGDDEVYSNCCALEWWRTLPSSTAPPAP